MSPPSHFLLPFRLRRNDAHPFVEAGECQDSTGCKKARKDDSLFPAFEKSPARKMTGRSCPFRLRRIGKELLFESADWRMSSIPSMNAPGIFRRFFVSRIFLGTFF